MRNIFTALLCLSLTGFAAAQAAGTGNTTQKTAATSSTQGTATTPAPTADVTATFVTTLGEIHCTLFPQQAPLTVANFIGLATGTKDWTDPKTGKVMHHVPLYNGTIFHRVIPNFMIQGGDPIGTGTGDPGYKFKDEFSDDLTFDQPGRLAMANSGPGTNGSQFFITEVPTPHLNGKHTIFGQCQDLELVKQIARLATDPRTDKPYNPPKIIKITIVDPRKPAPKATTPHKATGTTTHKSTTTTPKKTTPPSQQ